ncbi:RusA family crossover junction endodeoxyribonuclease [Shewanella oncorhynchi]|uniref:RusA family crossover junction endodeoxyribonuclease n=1 Tax=Shewanella oncorhynchi TaxID=2726434 RepID=UPI003D7BC903
MVGIINLDNHLGFMEHVESECEFYFNLNISPVSHQSASTAAKERKRELQASIRDALKSINFYIVGDITFYLQWNLHEHKRIETDGAADLDNILKPIIDSFTGFDALIIDDNQIDNIQAQWAHYYDYHNDKFTIIITYERGQLIPKDSLFLLQLEKSIYIPIKIYPDKESRKAELEKIIADYAKRKVAIEEEGYDRGTRRKNRMQRFFHVNRIDKQFKKGNKSEYLEQALITRA